MGGFDPFTTPTLSDLDLDRLAVAVATLDETVECPPVVAPESLDDVAEVVRIADGCLVVEYEPLRGRTVAQVREALSADLTVHAVGVPPRDIYPDRTRPASDVSRDQQWHLDEVNAENLWDSWPPGADVVVAVIDTGVDDSNVDLMDRVIDTGHVCHRQPKTGHGTHVAGIIAAERGNFGPVVGVAPEARILPIKIHFSGDYGWDLGEIFGKRVRWGTVDPDCHDDIPTLTAALTRAVNEGADVINMSFRWSLEEDKGGQDTAELAVRVATMDNIVVVTGAGNCGSEDRERLDANNCKERHERQRPAVYPGVIAVAATGEDRLWAPYSTSNRDVDIAAPGGVVRLIEGRLELILSTWPATVFCGDEEKNKAQAFPDQRTGTCWDVGTSMAAPVVSGVVAHMKARYPEASVAEIQYALYSTADRTNDRSNDSYRNDYGHGFINPVAAIRALKGLKHRTGDFVAVSSGNRHTCGLGTNGAVECWGDNDDGQTNAPAGVFTAVSAGGLHSCAINETSRAVECWGNNEEGQTNTPPSVAIVGGITIGDSFTAVSAGGFHSCGIRYGGTVDCWGRDNHDQTAAPEGNFADVSAGGLHTCGLAKPASLSAGIRSHGGAVECWGDNTYGQADAPGGNFVAVSAGEFHSCGIESGGTVECWGDNPWGQTDAPPDTFTAVSAGGFHTCGVTPSDTVKCWGLNTYGQTNPPTGGINHRYRRPTPLMRNTTHRRGRLRGPRRHRVSHNLLRHRQMLGPRQPQPNRRTRPRHIHHRHHRRRRRHGRSDRVREQPGRRLRNIRDEL